MKCKFCGKNFEGQTCPECGASAEIAGDSIPSTPPPAPNPSSNPKKPFYLKWWFWVIVAVIILGIIGAVAGGDEEITPPITSGITDLKTNKETTKEDLSKVAKEYTLTAGHYTAGIDFPAGQCDVVAISGTGNLSSSNMYAGGINAMFGIDTGAEMYTESFKGLKLPSKTTLSLNKNLKIKLTFTSIDSNFTGRTYDESAAVTLKDGNYEAGTDFKEGTYKIVAVSGKGNLSSSNLYEGGVNEIFGTDTSETIYNNQFLNADFKKGVALKVSGGLTIKLIPQK